MELYLSPRLSQVGARRLQCPHLWQELKSKMETSYHHSPGRVKFDKDIFAVIEHNLFEILANENIYGFVLMGRNRLTLELRLKLAIDILLNP